MKRLFSKNVKLKMVALLLAALSWYIVNQITNYDKAVSNLSLQVLLPDGWAVLGQTESEFQVIFRGTKEDLLLLDHRNVVLEADLRAEAFDEREFETVRRLRLDHRNVTHNSRARVYGIEPSSLEVRVVLEGQKQLPLRVNMTGEPVRGLRVETVTTEPQRATLYGARERLEALTSLQTSPLNLADRVGSFEQRVDVLPPTPDWVGRVEPSRVLVRVTLAGLTEDRRFPGVPVLLSQDPAAEPGAPMVPAPSAVEVSLKGSPELLDSLNPADIRAFAQAEAGANDARVFVNVPAGLEVLDVQPAQVRLRPRPAPTPVPTPTPEPEPEPAMDPE